LFRLKMLSAEEQQRLLQVNEPKVGERMKSNPAGLSREHLGHDSDETAMILGDQRLSYRELNARVDQLTRQLNELGIGPEKLAGVSPDQSMEMMVGLLGLVYEKLLGTEPDKQSAEINKPKGGAAQTSLAELFEQHAERTPAATAVIFGEQQLNYCE